jgi:alkylated DNA repair dioxygenase AlkB
MTSPRLEPQATRLSDGRVLVAGGAARDEGMSGEVVSSAEVFDPSTNRWTAVGDLLEPRRDGLAIVLDDGSVLVMGGDAEFNVHGDTPFCPKPLESVERFYPGS